MFPSYYWLRNSFKLLISPKFLLNFKLVCIFCMYNLSSKAQPTEKSSHHIFTCQSITDVRVLSGMCSILNFTVSAKEQQFLRQKYFVVKTKRGKIWVYIYKILIYLTFHPFHNYISSQQFLQILMRCGEFYFGTKKPCCVIVLKIPLSYNCKARTQ